jgi:CheY-like chemotaxis protein
VTPRILVVDDDRRVRQAIRWILEDEGYLVSEAADRGEALRLIAQTCPTWSWGVPAYGLLCPVERTG